jgi:O-succinylbenzoic acid--CoA ligase
MNRSIHCPIKEITSASPEQPALIDATHTITYSVLDREVDRVAAVITDKGIQTGDVVAVLARNSIQLAIIFYAAFRYGFTLMPLNRRLKPSDWIGQMDETGCSLFICDNEFPGENLLANTLSIDKFSNTNFDTSPMALPGRCTLDHEALIIFGSGTAGKPRGVLLTWSNLFYSAVSVNESIRLKGDDCWLAALPLFHIGGISILFRTVLSGCSAFIMDRFDTEGVLKAIGEKRVSVISVVPIMLAELIKSDKKNSLRQMKAIILGGAACDETLRREIIKRRLPVLTTYGMTETSSMITLSGPHDILKKPGSSGTVLPHRQLIIVDENIQALPPGRSGRIMVRGEVLFSRYVGQSSGDIFSADGWFGTGDMGKFDNDGYLTVTGRADSLIISGGENIDLDGIERAIGRLDGVNGVVALPCRDKKWGQRPVAFIEMAGNGIDENLLRKMLADQLPRIMIPDRIIILASLPLTGSGKYDRQALRNRYRHILEGRF